MYYTEREAQRRLAVSHWETSRHAYCTTTALRIRGSVDRGDFGLDRVRLDDQK
jgi:hypothetical protein